MKYKRVGLLHQLSTRKGSSKFLNKGYISAGNKRGNLWDTFIS